MTFVSFQCNDCEKRYPNRPANIFANRYEVRKHLKEIHGRIGFSYDKKNISYDAKGWKKPFEVKRIYYE